MQCVYSEYGTALWDGHQGLLHQSHNSRMRTKMTRQTALNLQILQMARQMEHLLQKAIRERLMMARSR